MTAYVVTDGDCISQKIWYFHRTTVSRKRNMQHDSFGEGKQEGLFKRIYIFIYYYSTEGPKATYTVGKSTRSEKHM